MASKKKPGVHVTPREDGWAVIKEGNKRASSLHSTKKEAEKAGRQAARKDNAELYLHNKKGRIGQRDSHGYDPYPPRG